MEIDLDIVDTIKIKMLKWYGHVQRMREEGLPKKVWMWAPGK